MYIRDNKILYLHIPRTGSQSVAKFFYDCLGIPDQFANTGPTNEIFSKKSPSELYQSQSPNERYLFAKNNHWKVPGPLVLTYMTLQEYVDHGYISREELLSTLKLVTVRNPYERIISACNYRKVAPDWLWLKKMTEENKRTSEKYRHFNTQVEYLMLDGEVAVDNIVKIEDIHNIPLLVSNRIDVEGKSVPHFNKYEGKIYQRVIERSIVSAEKVSDLSRETIDWINDHYHEDFEMFGYEKV